MGFQTPIYPYMDISASTELVLPQKKLLLTLRTMDQTHEAVFSESEGRRRVNLSA